MLFSFLKCSWVSTSIIQREKHSPLFPGLLESRAAFCNSHQKHSIGADFRILSLGGQTAQLFSQRETNFTKCRSTLNLIRSENPQSSFQNHQPLYIYLIGLSKPFPPKHLNHDMNLSSIWAQRTCWSVMSVVTVAEWNYCRGLQTPKRVHQKDRFQLTLGLASMGGGKWPDSHMCARKPEAHSRATLHRKTQFLKRGFAHPRGKVPCSQGLWRDNSQPKHLK